jgi:ABC-type uncharacterized transport system auxiliary subunit
MTDARKFVWAFAALSTLTACEQPPVPEDHFYRLEVTATTPDVQPLTGTVVVERFIADGVVADRPIAYSDRGNHRQVRAYHYHFWVEPPTVMLQNQMVAFLRASGVAERVVTPELRVQPDFIVAGKIIRFEQVRGSPPAIAAELELSLRRSSDSRVLVLETRKVEGRAADDSVGAAVDAMSQAVSQIFLNFAAALP